MTRLVELEPTKFICFLLGLWTQWNQQMNAQPRGEGRYLVQGQYGDSTKELILVLPTVEMTVETEHIKSFVTHMKKHGVDTVVAVTQGEFADMVRGLATDRDVTLFDRDRLGKTVADKGLEQTIKQYVDDDMFETVEIEFGLPSDLPEPVGDASVSLPIVVVRERLVGLIDGHGDAGGSDGDNDGSSGNGSDGGSSVGSLRDKLPSPVDDLKSGSPPGVRVVVVTVSLLVLTLGPVAMLGPMLGGLGGSSGGSSGGDHGVSVSTLSSASAGSTDIVARRDTRATDTLWVGNQTYTPSEEGWFVVVGFNATATDDSPGSLSQSALVFESDGVRYGHQPLSDTTGFDSGGLFTPGDDIYVWTVFIVPTNATTGTVFIQSTNEDTVALVHDDAVSANPNGDD